MPTQHNGAQTAPATVEEVATTPVARPAGPTPAAPALADADGGHDETVRLLAYSLYEARGGTGGHAMEDWLQAEAMLLGSTAEPSPLPTA